MLVRFIGDPKRIGDFQSKVKMYGFEFELNGNPVYIERSERNTHQQNSNVPALQEILKRHKYFQVVTPALLKKEAEEAAKRAAEAAELAKAEADKAMEEAGNGTDEVSVDDEGAAVPGRPRGRRRG